MPRLDWITPRDFESGADRGVYYPKNAPGESWNGLIAVLETQDGSAEMIRYLDGIKTNGHRRIGYFSGTIETFTYPESFFDDVFVQKQVETFGMSYRVDRGDSYQIHLVYNVSISPSALKHTPAVTAPFQWNFTTIPVDIPGATKTSRIIIDSSMAHATTVSALEDILYGTVSDSARLPTPAEILALFEQYSILRVVDHGDGTFTVTGPDSAIQMLNSTTFQISWPSAVYIDEVSYTLSSL